MRRIKHPFTDYFTPLRVICVGLWVKLRARPRELAYHRQPLHEKVAVHIIAIAIDLLLEASPSHRRDICDDVDCERPEHIFLPPYGVDLVYKSGQKDELHFGIHVVLKPGGKGFLVKVASTHCPDLNLRVQNHIDAIAPWSLTRMISVSKGDGLKTYDIEIHA